MSNNMSLLCRAEGKVYLSINLKPKLADETLRAFSLFDNKHSFPVELIPYSAAQQNRKYVIIAFDMAIKQKIVVTSKRKGCPEQTVFSQTISPHLASLSSKVNGRIRSKECEYIRRIDDYRSTQPLTFSPVRFIQELDNGWLFVVRLIGFNPKDDSLNITAISPDGKNIPFSIFPLIGNTATEQTGEDYAAIFRLESKCQSLCIGTVSNNGTSSSSIAVFSSRQLKYFKDNYKLQYSDVFTNNHYSTWFISQKTQQNQLVSHSEKHLKNMPLFSIIVPLYQTPQNFFIEMIESVLAQSYKNWELILVNASTEILQLHQTIESYVESDSRIISVDLEKNLGITENTNEGIKIARGDYICFFDHDDVLEPDILFEYAHAINANPDIGLLYCDEDKLFPNGILKEPSFKPDFNLFLLRDNNYICHLLTVKKGLIDEIETPTQDLDGAQDHSLALQIAETKAPIHHVAKILYHWRVSDLSTSSNSNSKPYATAAGIRAVQRHLNRSNIIGQVECSHGRAFRYKTDYPLSNNCGFDILLFNYQDSTLDAANIKTHFNNYDHLPYNFVYAHKESSITKTTIDQDIECIQINNALSWADFMNNALSQVSSRYVLVMDSRFSLISQNWDTALFGLLCLEDVAMSVPMQCDASGVIQSAGMSFVGGKVMPLFHGLPHGASGYLFRALSTQEVSLAAPSCFAIDMTIFKQLNGFDQALHNQIDAMSDLCLRIRKFNKKIVYTPEAEARSSYITNNMIAHIPEKAFMDKWNELINSMDPFLNKNLSLVPEQCIRFKIDSIPT